MREPAVVPRLKRKMRRYVMCFLWPLGLFRAVVAQHHRNPSEFAGGGGVGKRRRGFSRFFLPVYGGFPHNSGFSLWFPARGVTLSQ